MEGLTDVTLASSDPSRKPDAVSLADSNFGGSHAAITFSIFAVQVLVSLALREEPGMAVAGSAIIFFLGILCFPPIALSLLFTVVIWQNLFFAVILPDWYQKQELNTLQALPTVAYLVTGMFAIFRLLNRQGTKALPQIWWLFAIAIAIYTAIGVARFGFGPATLQLRNIAVFLLSLAIGCAYLSTPRQLQVFYRVARVTTVLVLIYGALEIFASRWLYETINYVLFTAIKYPESNTFGLDSLMDFMSKSFLNISGLDAFIRTVRLSGPNLHPISFGYILLFLIGLHFYVKGEINWLLVAVFAAAGIKGPLVALAFAVSAVFLLKVKMRNKAALLIGSVIFGYVAIFLFNYSRGNDIHVVGLVGGIKAFLSNPLGSGLGATGNFNVDRDVQAWLRTGISFGVESAFGVYIHQIGAVFLFFFYRLSKRLTALVNQMYEARDDRALAAIVLTLCTLWNGFFQEEAFGLPAMGFWGVLLGSLILLNEGNRENSSETDQSLWMPSAQLGSIGHPWLFRQKR